MAAAAAAIHMAHGGMKGSRETLERTTSAGMKRMQSLVKMQSSCDAGVPFKDIIMEAALYKLDGKGNWQARSLVLTKEKLLITAVKPPLHREGLITHLGSSDQDGAGLVYLVLSEGMLSFWLSQEAYTQGQPCTDSIPISYLSKVHALTQSSQSRYIASRNHNDSRSGAPWEVRDGRNGRVFEFSSESRAQRTSWMNAIVQHQKELSCFEFEHVIADTIPTRDIVEVDTSFPVV